LRGNRGVRLDQGVDQCVGLEGLGQGVPSRRGGGTLSTSNSVSSAS
jgi:hypothetical protein